jgi:L-fuconolactonase
VPPPHVIDSHVHLWDSHRYRIPWLDSVPTINRTYDLSDYAAATAGLDVAGIVYLQVEVAPPYALLEARDLVELARRDERVMGVVPWAPLEFGDQVSYFLEELIALGDEIKGVRRIVQDEPDPEFCLRPDFVRGNELLPEFGLTSDLCCNFRQLGPIVELVRRCPGTQFILDHIAKPNIFGGAFEPWASQMRDMAALPNVMCKISGVVTEANHASWTIEEIKPFVLHAMECFGEQRVVFGSDWPVVTQAAELRRWVEALDELTAGLSDEAKRLLWSANARRFYRL